MYRTRNYGMLRKWGIYVILFHVLCFFTPLDAFSEAGLPVPGVQAQVPPQTGEEEIFPDPGKVTVNFKDVDIGIVLQYLSEVSGLDIIPTPGVDAQITMRLRNKPWEVALELVTRNYGYVYTRDDDRGIVRVMPKGLVQ